MRRSILLAFYGLTLSSLCLAPLGCDGEVTVVNDRPPKSVSVRVTGDMFSMPVAEPEIVTVKARDTINWFYEGQADTLKIDLSLIPGVLAIPPAVGENVTTRLVIPSSNITPPGDYKYTVILKFGADSTVNDPRVIVEE